MKKKKVKDSYLFSLRFFFYSRPKKQKVKIYLKYVKANIKYISFHILFFRPAVGCRGAKFLLYLPLKNLSSEKVAQKIGP
jgi:hypothetical protein